MSTTATTVQVPTQRELMQAVAYRLAIKSGEAVVEVKTALEEALRTDEAEYGGEVFGGTQTPRNSARRALYACLDANVLLIRDGHGVLRFKKEVLHDAILQGDAWEILKLLPSESIGCIIADGPNTSLDEHRNVGKATRICNGQFFKTKDIDLELVREFYRVLTPGSYCFLYMPPMQSSSPRIWKQMLDAVEATGFEVIRNATWDKLLRGMGYRFTSQTEPILVLGKLFRDGRLPDCKDRTVTDIIKVKALRGNERTPYTDWTPADEQAWKDAELKYGGRGEIPREVRKALPGKYHETEKPPEVARVLLRVANKPGELLVDCFAGTGHGAVVAHEFAMPYVAIEGNPRTVEHCLAPRLAREGHAAKTIIEVVA